MRKFFGNSISDKRNRTDSRVFCNLCVQEAAKYFHVGDKKLRKLIDEHPDAEFILWNGSRPQIKRRVFERFVDEK